MGKPYIYVMGPIWDVYIYIIIYIYVYIYIYIYVYIYIYIYIYIYGKPIYTLWDQYRMCKVTSVSF